MVADESPQSDVTLASVTTRSQSITNENVKSDVSTLEIQSQAERHSCAKDSLVYIFKDSDRHPVSSAAQLKHVVTETGLFVFSTFSGMKLICNTIAMLFKAS